MKNCATQIEENYDKIKVLFKFCESVAGNIKVSSWSNFLDQEYIPECTKTRWLSRGRLFNAIYYSWNKINALNSSTKGDCDIFQKSDAAKIIRQNPTKYRLYLAIFSIIYNEFSIYIKSNQSIDYSTPEKCIIDITTLICHGLTWPRSIRLATVPYSHFHCNPVKKPKRENRNKIYLPPTTQSKRNHNNNHNSIDDPTVTESQSHIQGVPIIADRINNTETEMQRYTRISKHVDQHLFPFDNIISSDSKVINNIMSLYKRQLFVKCLKQAKPISYECFALSPVCMMQLKDLIDDLKVNIFGLADDDGMLSIYNQLFTVNNQLFFVITKNITDYIFILSKI